MSVKGCEGFSVSPVHARARDAVNAKRVHLPSQTIVAAMTAVHQQALAALADAQQRLTELNLAADRDLPAIVEAGENARRAERRIAAIERGGQ